MCKRFLIISVIILILIASSSFAQGEYLGKGKSAYAGSFSLAYDNGESAKSFAISGSYEGLFDLGFNFFPNKYSGGSLALFSNWHIRNNRKGINLTLNGSLDFDNSYLYTISPIIHTNLALSDHAFLKPFGGVGLIDKAGNDLHYNNTFYQFGLDIFFITDNNLVIAITPAVVSYDSESNFGISLTILTQVPKKKQFKIED